MKHAVYLNWSLTVILWVAICLVIVIAWSLISVRIKPYDRRIIKPKGNWLTTFAYQERKKNTVKLNLQLSVPSLTSMVMAVTIPSVIFGKLFVSEHWLGVRQLWINLFLGIDEGPARFWAAVTVVALVCLYGWILMGAMMIALEWAVSRRLQEFADEGQAPIQIRARGGLLYAILLVITVIERRKAGKSA